MHGYNRNWCMMARPGPRRQAHESSGDKARSLLAGPKQKSLLFMGGWVWSCLGRGGEGGIGSEYWALTESESSRGSLIDNSRPRCSTANVTMRHFLNQMIGGKACHIMDDHPTYLALPCLTLPRYKREWIWIWMYVD